MRIPTTRFALALFVAFSAVSVLAVSATANADDGATIKGKVSYNKDYAKSWNGHKLVEPYGDIKTRLFERVEVPPVPFPKNWTEMKPEDQQKWAKEFELSEAGKKYIANRDKIIEEANAFDVQIEKDGSFTVFDVPPGTYGLQGRVDKEIDGVNHGFEVFAQIEIGDEVKIMKCPPIEVAVTPLLQPKTTAPPISVTTYNGEKTLTLDTFKGEYLFVNFWITDSPSATFQNDIQKVYADLKAKHGVRMLSICVDDDRKKAVEYIIKEKLKEGSHGFTEGFDHRTIFDYGIRSIPSFWLISPDGKIAMTQFEFARAFRSGEDDLGVIISNRILGKDTPTPAKQEGEEKEQKGDEAKAELKKAG